LMESSSDTSLASSKQHTFSDKRARAWYVAASVLDPEIPVVTVEELGILRGVDININGTVVAKLTPTYSGCPAVQVIEDAVKDALEADGFQAKIERVLSPPWTTDWISEDGLSKLKAYGIAPPEKTSRSKRALFSKIAVGCPNCNSNETRLVSEFGSTACKAHYQCLACKEPFDYFKCL